ncbi:MAG: DNA modification methylase [Planctomycetota bacterium]|jgi:DNA modification methylase
MAKKKARPKAAKYEWIAEKLRPLAVPVATLHTDPNNARTHDADNLTAIEASLKQFGQVSPIVANSRNQDVVIGNGRFTVATERLGWSHIAVVWRDLTEAQQRALSVADNRTAELAGWDEERLEAELALLEDHDSDLYADLLLADLRAEDSEPAEVEEVEPQIDRAAELQEKWGTKSGDLWVIPSKTVEGGEHRVLCGDSTKAEDVERVMGGRTAAVCFTSPPYNVAAKSSLPNKEKYIDGGDNRDEHTYLNLITNVTVAMLRVSRFVFVNVQSVAGNKTALIDYLVLFRDRYADTIIWDKQTAEPAMARRVLNSQFEFVHVFSAAGNRAIGTRDFRGTNTNVLALSNRADKDNSDIHKATYATEFVAFFVREFTNNSEVITDPFLGSGTTLVAAEQLSRLCYGIEIEPKYVAVVLERTKDLGLEPRLEA